MARSRKQQAAIAISKRRSGGLRGILRPTGMTPAGLAKLKRDADEAKARVEREAAEAKAKAEREAAEAKAKIDKKVAEDAAKLVVKAEEKPADPPVAPALSPAQILAARKAPVPPGVLSGISPQVKPGYYGVQPGHGLGRSRRRSRKHKRKTRRHRR